MNEAMKNPSVALAHLSRLTEFLRIIVPEEIQGDLGTHTAVEYAIHWLRSQREEIVQMETARKR